MVHTGACVASILGQGGSRKYNLTWKWLRFFKNDRDRRDLVTCGAAAGIAASFRAPVGGVLFAFEEMASWYSHLLMSLFILNSHDLSLFRNFIRSPFSLCTCIYFIHMVMLFILNQVYKFILLF